MILPYVAYFSMAFVFFALGVGSIYLTVTGLKENGKDAIGPCILMLAGGLPALAISIAMVAEFMLGNVGMS